MFILTPRFVLYLLARRFARMPVNTVALVLVASLIMMLESLRDPLQGWADRQRLKFDALEPEKENAALPVPP